MKIIHYTNYNSSWRNIKFLKRRKWYRQLVGGTWHCILTNLSTEGYFREWTLTKPDDMNILLHVECYKNNYRWNRPFNKPIIVKDIWQDKDTYYYYYSDKSPKFHCLIDNPAKFIQS